MKKTPNIERRTSNTERRVVHTVVKEPSDSVYATQRKSKYDLEDRRLAARLKTAARPENLAQCLNEAEELIRIFVASIRTAERNCT
jgi:hypothetical protein